MSHPLAAEINAEMLSALKSVEDMFGWIAGDCSDPDQAAEETALMERVRSIIAKAEGRDPED